MNKRLACCFALSAVTLVSPASPSDPIERIKDEGLNRSQAMNYVTDLSDVIGPRVSGSPEMRRAVEWARTTLAGIGLENAHLEPWGMGPLGWRLRRFSAQVIEPQCIPLIAYPKWLSPGVKGEVVGDVVAFDARGPDDLDRFRGQLRGTIVLLGGPADVKPSLETHSGRKSDAELLEMSNAPMWTPQSLLPPRNPSAPPLTRPAWRPSVIQQFLHDEGVLLTLQTSHALGGTLFVGNWVAQDPASMVDDPAKSASGKEWQENAVPQLVLAAEQYGRLLRMVQMGARLKMAVQLAVDYSDPAVQSNVIAEIPGSDLKDQIVMLGAHLDSWHAGTGAVDNGAGVAISMEAVRILKALQVVPRRTIRIALWDAEELTSRGAHAYVTEHFGQVETAQSPGATPVRTLKRGPEYEKLSAYYNVDLGSGRIRGVYLEGNEQLRAIFREWLVPLRPLGAWTISADDGGGSDHRRFDQVGLPGLLFIQDDLQYETAMHSNFDVPERADAADLKQAAIVMATFVYNTAMRQERLPRRPIAIPVR
jgi:carboxypeptidase Q